MKKKYGIQDRILTHPSLTHARDLNEICRPLNKLNISYFSHVQYGKDGKAAGIGLNPEFAKHYLNLELYNYDIHVAKSDLLKDIIIWDHLELDKQTQNMDSIARQFGIKHAFTIVENNLNSVDYYHFATAQDYFNNQIYLSHLDLLKIFIFEFKEKVNYSKDLQRAYNLRFVINPHSANFHIKNTLENNIEQSRKDFFQDLQIDKKIIIDKNISLSLRELQVLAWMHLGKNARDIATILGVADVTINKHIANLKLKLNCYTYFQLGEFFAKLTHHSKDFIKYLLANP